MIRRYLSIGLLLMVFLPSYPAMADKDESHENRGWLADDWSKARPQVQSQFRGSDVAMMEVGYRFSEFFFAGKDHNWDYADYQLEAMEKAIRLMIERRPKRAKSAKVFLEEDLPDVVRLTKERSPESFDRAAERLRVSCMKCHVAENYSFVTVQFPTDRQSPVRNAD